MHHIWYILHVPISRSPSDAPCILSPSPYNAKNIIDSHQILFKHFQVADRVIELLGTAGIPCHKDHKRGFDHGVFIPLKASFEDTRFPVVQLSLKAGKIVMLFSSYRHIITLNLRKYHVR